METAPLKINPDGTQTAPSGVTYSASGGAVIPTAPVDASALGGTTPFTLPPAPVPSSFDISTLPSISSLLNPAKSQTETDLDTQQQQLAADSAKIGGKAAAQISAEDAAARSLGATTGLADFSSQLRDVNAQITQLQADATAASNTSEDRLAPTFAIRGEQAQIERQRSVKALGLTAIAQTLQGNIASAQDYASRSVDVEFAPVQAEIDYLTKAIDINRDKLSREDQERADTLQVQLQARQEQLDQDKDNKSKVYDVMLEAAKAGADSSTLNKIMASSSPDQAISLAGNALGADFQRQLRSSQLQDKLTQAQIDKIYSDIDSGNGQTLQTADDLTSIMGSAKVSSGTKTSLGNILGVINAAETLAKANSTGEFAGFYPGASLVDLVTPKGLKRDATIKNEGYLDGINLKVQQWASGASLTKQQIDQVNKLVPTKNDTDRTAADKLNNLVNFMNQQIKGSLQTEGIDYQPQEVDLFNKQETLADIFNS